MKIILLSPPFVREYMRNARCDFVSLSATQWYPVLLGYCGAWLEGQGHEVKLIDAPAHDLDHNATEAIVKAYKPDLIVLYTGRMSEQNDLEFGDKLAGDLGCDAVIVGPFASIDPEGTLSRAKTINKLIVSEFEYPVGELAGGHQPGKIPNLLYKQNGGIVRNPQRPYLNGTELDAIPFLSRFLSRQVDVYRYKTPSEFYPYMDIMSGRGCAWGFCTYCLWVNTYVKGQTYNVRSILNVVEEFDYIAGEMPEVRSVMIQDDTFTEERALAFSEAKIKADNKLPWSCYARGNMSYEVLKAMKDAGCRNLHVGYESADAGVLRNIRKGVTKEQMTKFTAAAKKAGLRIHGDFAFGFPGETAETAKATIKWAKELNPHTAQFQLMIPFPGTPFYSLLKEKGWLTPEGEPDYPDFSNAEIRAWAKKAYRAYYLSPQYAWKVIRHPYEHFFGRLKTISRAIPALFWKKWDVGIKESDGENPRN